MKKILIFAGTTEGRELSDSLEKNGIMHIVSVVSEYGEAMMGEGRYRTLKVGRMDESLMEDYLKSESFSEGDYIIDATHPYATEVSQNARRVASDMNLNYLRVVRERVEIPDSDSIYIYESMEQCAAELNNLVSDKKSMDLDESYDLKVLKESGGFKDLIGSKDMNYSNDSDYSKFSEYSNDFNYPNEGILLTTGSKELECYIRLVSKDILKNTYVRILPSLESFEKCKELGIEESHIIALQGPFGMELNAALFKQYHIRHLVTKESGKEGGFEEKIKAAESCDVISHVIRRPVEEGGLELAEVENILLSSCGFAGGESSWNTIDISAVLDVNAYESSTGESIAEESVADESSTDERIAEESIADESSIDERIAEESIADESSTEKSITEEKITNKNISEENIAEEITLEEYNSNSYPYRAVPYFMVDAEIILAGAGMGDSTTLTTEVSEAIKQADVVFGAKRLIEAVSDKDKYDMFRAMNVLSVLTSHPEYKKAVVLFSGDSGFYSGTKDFIRAMDAYQVGFANEDKISFCGDIKVLPGISSVSCLAAKLGVSYEDAGIYSLHGRFSEVALNEVLWNIRYREKTFVLFSGASEVSALAEGMLNNGIQGEITLGINLGKKLEKNPEDTVEKKPGKSSEENLEINSLANCEKKARLLLGKKTVKTVETVETGVSSDIEEILTLSLEEAVHFDKSGSIIGYVFNPETERRPLIPYFSDEEFIREKTPITKEVIRHESIRRLELKEGDIVFDIGGGTGSVAIEIAGLHPSLRVVTVERKRERVDIIKQNIEAHHVANVKVVEGNACSILKRIEKPDAVFVGGSGGELEDIIRLIAEKGSGTRFVINSVTMETIKEIERVLDKLKPHKRKAVQIGVSNLEEIGAYHMFQAENPVMIYSFVL